VPDLTDNQIAGGLRKADSDAWSALYEVYFDDVWRWVARLIGSESADIGDIVQETFLSAARSAASYDPARGSLWLWLTGIARNHVSAYYRARQRDRRIRPGGDLEADATARLTEWFGNRHSDPPDALDSAEATTLVRSAVAQLPVDYQRLLIARYCDEASNKQIAQSSGCSLEAIRSKIARARRAFRRVFGKEAECQHDGTMGARHDR
jgi:RNA polymerase sigma-70 factor (ECF subfamily)